MFTPKQTTGSSPEPVDMFDTLPSIQPQNQPASMPGQPAQQPLPVVTPPSYSRPTHRKKSMILLAVLFFLLIILGTGVYAGYSFYYSPQRVAKKAIENFLHMTTVTYSVEIVPQFATDQRALNMVLGYGTSDVRATIAGYSDMRDTAHPRATADVSIYMNDNSGNQNAYSFETKSVDQAVYVNISRAPEFPFFPLEKIENQWIELNPKKLAETFPLPKNIQNQLEHPAQSSITDEQKQQLKTAFVQHPFIALDQRVGAEEIHGVNTNHYTTTVDKDALKEFLQTAQSIVNNGVVSPKKIDEFLQDFDHASNVQFDVWIGKRDYQFYQWKLVVPTDTESLKSLSVTAQLWDHNVPVDITVPENAMPLDEFIQNAFGIDINTLTKEPTPTPATNDTVDNEPTAIPEVEDVDTNDVTVKEETTNTNGELDSDGDGLSDEDEKQYGTDPKDLDSDSDGYTDGEEVEHGYNPMGEGTLPV